MISFLILLCAMVLAGGGLAVTAIFTIIVGIIRAIIVGKNPEKKEIKNKSEPEKIREDIYYRYELIDMTTKQVIGVGNDYLAVCRRKRDLGTGIMIRDKEYKKKSIIV